MDVNIYRTKICKRNQKNIPGEFIANGYTSNNLKQLSKYSVSTDSYFSSTTVNHRKENINRYINKLILQKYYKYYDFMTFK